MANEDKFEDINFESTKSRNLPRILENTACFVLPTLYVLFIIVYFSIYATI